MSFRELHNFIEIMKSLSFPRLISVENFRTPNFDLVAECLDFLVQRYDETIDIPFDTEDKHGRVQFITSVAEVMMTKARIKLNTKHLYLADGHAVREMLKICDILRQASNSLKKASPESKFAEAPIGRHDVKSADARQITETGAKLYHLLANEADMRKKRQRIIRFLDTVSAGTSTTQDQFIEKSLRDIIATTEENVDQMTNQQRQLETDQKQLESRIQKTRQELERTEKRLKSLKNMRPSYMDEYEKLEDDLQNLYKAYLARSRNLQYLEHELELQAQAENQRVADAERRLKQMQRRLKDEALDQMRGGAELELRPNAKNGGGFNPDAPFDVPRVKGRLGGMSDDDDDDSSTEDSSSGSENSDEESSDEEISLGDSDVSGTDSDLSDTGSVSASSYDRESLSSGRDY
eukprot:TRINITY_DN776093_c0_g1_i1.p1 TRINITY_DN776093_c0_g1~~TRINITY_DN776093_c0_g1_i1.p1  ORF type:complete len:408 (+),score=133.69 TRINITY_DN776093_c0_g1_i1:72-1295(+)